MIAALGRIITDDDEGDGTDDVYFSFEILCNLWKDAKEQYAPREAELLAKIERLEERESELVEAVRNASDHYEECELPDGGMGAMMPLEFMSQINGLVDQCDEAIGDKQ